MSSLGAFSIQYYIYIYELYVWSLEAIRNYSSPRSFQLPFGRCCWASSPVLRSLINITTKRPRSVTRWESGGTWKTQWNRVIKAYSWKWLTSQMLHCTRYVSSSLSIVLTLSYGQPPKGKTGVQLPEEVFQSDWWNFKKERGRTKGQRDPHALAKKKTKKCIKKNSAWSTCDARRPS